MTRVSASLTERVSRTGFSVTPARSEPPAPPMNSTVVSAGSQFSAIRSTAAVIGAGIGAASGRSCSSSTYHDASSPVVETISRRRPGQATLGSIFSMIVERIGDVGAAPARAGLCDLKIAPGRGAAAAHADAGRRHVEEAAGLVLGQHARDVVVDHDHLVGVPRPLLRKDADRGRAAADPHALLLHAVHDRCSTRLQRDRSTAVDRDLDRRAVAELQQRLAGDVALALGAAGQVAHAAEREHLRAVFGGGDVADLLAVGAHRRLLGPEIAVGVDLHLQAAIAEDALRDDGHHVDALDLARDDEGCGLVVGIGGAGADAGDERLRPDQLAVPVGGVLEERHPGLGALGDHERIDPDQEASLVGVAIACADLAGPDPAEHRACVAPDNLVSHGCDHPAAWSTAIKCPCTGAVKAGPAPAGARCCAAAQGGISLWPCGADEPT